MNIYRLRIIEHAGYDSVVGFVIAAESETAARAVPFAVFMEGSSDGCRIECRHLGEYEIDDSDPQTPCVWANPMTSTCEPIGVALAQVPAGIVLRDFRAG